MVNVTSGGVLTLGSIIIDGQGGHPSYGDGNVDADTALITVDGGTLIVNDTADLRNNKNTATNGGGVSVTNSGTLTINGDIIRNSAAGNGGGVYIDNGTLTINDGYIQINTATNGGGVYVMNSNRVTIKAVRRGIYNNKATVDGGGVYIANGIISMSGGKITGNSAAGNGGGIYLDPNVTALNLSGTLNISGNRQGTVVGTSSDPLNNIYFTNTTSESDVKITDSIVATGTTIGLSPSNPAYGATLVTSTDANFINASHFSMDDNAKFVAKRDTKLVVSVTEVGRYGGYVFTMTNADGTMTNYEISDALPITYTWADAKLQTSWNGSSGWHLPTKEDLHAPYTELFASGKPLTGDTNFYWSSSELNDNYAWRQVFASGGQGSDYKTYKGSVRVVRGF